MILSAVLQAVGLFIVINIDGIIILSLFFGRGQGQQGTTRRILLCQYLGFIGILGIAHVRVLLSWRGPLPYTAYLLLNLDAVR